MRFLLQTSLFSIFFFVSIASRGQDLPITYLNHEDKVIYDLQLKYKEYKGSGLLVLTKKGPGNYQGALVTKVGFTLLQFELVNGNFEWTKILEYLDKWIIRKALQKDFTFLMLAELDDAKIKMKEETDAYKLMKVKAKYPFNLKTINNRPVYLKERGFCVVGRTIINFEYQNANELIPDKMELSHKGIDSEMKLKRY
ncbi:hypothetical protein [Marinigracilibium pacificum]|uniref:Uncharacterized protein n=1 Tax=Marinigracilibium pacificum TaxID=2729599 RepID=A0A848ITR7_9BACT|nr:hypothetical protein [Marinigracilibium pacificum]NMM47883.1 hypothetical protein [Marinigracilibium pacificum]